MPMLDMHDYTTAARRYWWLVTLLGFGALGAALVGVAHMPMSSLLPALGGAAAAAIAGYFPVKIPGGKTSFAAGEIFVFLVLMAFGWPAAVIAAATEGFVASWRTSKRWTSRLGTPAMASLAMFACGMIFQTVANALQSHGLAAGAQILALLVFACFYYAANILMPYALIALKRGEIFAPVAQMTSQSWILMAYLAHASIACVLFMGQSQFGAPGLLVALPLIAMFVTSLHFWYRRKEADEIHLAALRESESRFHSAFAHAAVGMALLDGEMRLSQVNRSFCGMLGLQEAQLAGKRLDAMIMAEDVQLIENALAPLRSGAREEACAEVRGHNADGSVVWMSLAISLGRDWKLRDQQFIVQAQNVTERRLAEAKLHHEAFHDGLTHLPNRRSFNDSLARTLARSLRDPDCHFAVCYLDFDRFKLVNDSLGHSAGDALLVAVASRLRSAIQPADVLARLGGDEFAIIVEGMRDRDVLELCERLHIELRRPIELNGLQFCTSASIGVTFSTHGYESPEQIVRDADLAMYKAKSNGRAQTAVYDPTLHHRVSSQLALENDLRGAMTAGEIYLDYQPIYSLTQDRLIGFEALARWNHPMLGVLSPADFIPVAEETGLIVPIGAALLEKACMQMRQWGALEDGRGLRMSVNVSAIQFQDPDFLTQVTRALHQAGMDPSQLMLEVTESVLMGNGESVMTTLKMLRRMGVMLSIDDFGVGYSSLGYLASMPIDTLKLDRSFIQSMTNDLHGNEVVRAIFALASALDMKVIAEGVESHAQLSMLEKLGCEFAQGYLLSEPLPAARAYSEGPVTVTREANAPALRRAGLRVA